MARGSEHASTHRHSGTGAQVGTESHFRDTHNSTAPFAPFSRESGSSWDGGRSACNHAQESANVTQSVAWFVQHLLLSSHLHVLGKGANSHQSTAGSTKFRAPSWGARAQNSSQFVSFGNSEIQPKADTFLLFQQVWLKSWGRYIAPDKDITCRISWGR